MRAPPVRRREIALGGRDVDRVVRDDGSTVVRNREPLGAYARCIPEFLVRYAAEAPDRSFLAERDAGGAWNRLTYGDALARVRAIASSLVARGLSDQRPVVILSDNGIDHALLGLAAQYAGILFAPVSPAYSLLATDFGKLRAIVDILRPGLIYAADGARYARAIAAVLGPGVELVVSGPAPPGHSATPFAALLETPPSSEADARYAAVGPDTVAKILFTSGSTGSPKGVINTQRMMCSNVQMDLQAHPFLAETPPVIVDWLPWNHTFGGNHNFNEVLGNGGTLYVNAGKPVAGAFAESVRNLDDVQPNVHYDVPKGYELLAEALRADARFRGRFFERVQMLMYAGAALSQHVWDALIELSVEAAGERILTTSSIGSTETAPMATAAPWWGDASGNIGIPVPGVEMKLVPNGEKLEVRFRGPNITPGYWHAPELTAAAFDDEGFYRIGDALRYADERDPACGFFFDGRIAEDFKLATATWVSYGPLRAHALAHFAPLFVDVVLTGENRDEVGMIAFPDLVKLRALATDVPADADAATVVASRAVRRALQTKLEALAASATGSARRIERLVVATDPPSLAAGEATDKGSLNARTVLRQRAGVVETLHAAQPPAEVIVAGRGDPP